MKSEKICVICILIMFILTAKAQKLNETYLLARADMLHEQYAEAGQKILSIPANERSSQMYLTLGESYYLTGKYDKSVRFFAAADSVKANPEAELYAARACAMMQQPAKAAEWLQKYLSQRDKITESELTLDPAFEKIEHSKEWKSLWNKEWYNAAERKAAEAAVLLKRKKYTDALSIVDAEITRSGSARFYALRAKIYEAMEQYEPAHESAQTAVRMRGSNLEYSTGAANIAVQVKKYDIALDNINQVIRLDPYNLELYLQRAAILRMLQRYDDARKDINFYFKYLPADTKALFEIGLAETEAGNALAGIEYFTMLIDNDKTTPEYYVARADAQIRSNNYTLAGDDLSQALDLNPDLPDAWLKKGVVLHREDNLDDACYYWRKAFGKGNREAGEYIYKYCRK
jgi:tetratricopeptide (TPR) repeat protein